MDRIEVTDTIVAISTAGGPAPRAILRISGNRAEEICGGLFHTRSGKNLHEVRSYTAIEGQVVLDGRAIIPATLFIMRAPWSYTREDVFEVHTIGSPPLLRSLLNAFIKAGARLAAPGEFTRRAFLNGRLDLARAESVMAIVRSRSESELRAATQQLRGALGDVIRRLRDELSELCALAETAIDFSDQDVQIISPKEMASRLQDLAKRVKVLGQRPYRRTIDEAVSVAIVGNPNVGKSSLLNALVERYGSPGYDRRAIVSHVPGTTRDILEAHIRVQGVEFRLLDTAGLCQPQNEVEAKAVERARIAHEQAEMKLMVLDAASETPSVHEFSASEGLMLVVLNKADIARNRTECKGAIWTSALTGEGLDLLVGRMVELVLSGRLDKSGSMIVANARQQEALERAEKAILAAVENLESEVGFELVAFEMRTALNALGEIVGEVCTEDLLDRIFSQFCIGK